MNDARSSDRAMVIWSGRVLVDSEFTPLTISGAAFAAGASATPVALTGDGSVGAYLLEAPDEASALAAVNVAAPGAFADVMYELGRYSGGQRSAMMRAVAIERWSNRYRFCPPCGAALVWTTDAVAKICLNPQRVHRHFPRLDPAIIVLVTNGERALLGRAARWPAGFYSTLAGFVEPGESLEAAIRREVAEEAGIDVGAVSYFGSESWPFPRSLMLGFFAAATSVDIELRDGELEDARWFTAPQLAELQAGMKIARPYFDTIARRLIDTWLAQQAAEPSALRPGQ